MAPCVQAQAGPLRAYPRPPRPDGPRRVQSRKNTEMGWDDSEEEDDDWGKYLPSSTQRGITEPNAVAGAEKKEEIVLPVKGEGQKQVWSDEEEQDDEDDEEEAPASSQAVSSQATFFSPADQAVSLCFVGASCFKQPTADSASSTSGTGTIKVDPVRAVCTHGLCVIEADAQLVDDVDCPPSVGCEAKAPEEKDPEGEGGERSRSRTSGRRR